MIIGDYASPLSDSFLYRLAHEVIMGGTGDADDLVQEGRIKMWQMWQEEQWFRNTEPRPVSYYVKAVKRRMQAVCYRKYPPFGANARQGYSDAFNHVTVFLDRQPETEDGSLPPEIERLVYETPFELLDRVPAVLMGLVG